MAGSLNHEMRIAELEEKARRAELDVEAIWAHAVQLTRIVLVSREAVRRASGGEADRDLRQTQRMVIALARKADLFGDDELADLFNEASG